MNIKIFKKKIIMVVNYNVKLIKLREFLFNKFNCIFNELE